MVMARVIPFVKRAPRGFLFCRWDVLSIFIQFILISFLPVALCASDAEVYEIGVDVDGTDENLMWVDRNPYFDAALTLFHVVDTEEHDDHYLLPYAIVAFLSGDRDSWRSITRPRLDHTSLKHRNPS